MDSSSPVGPVPPATQRPLPPAAQCPLPPAAQRPLPPPRALAPDMARGFMLLLIAIANVSWHLWGHPTGLTAAHPTDGNALDTALATVAIIFIDGRIYPMFAFLFGYGMVQFARSRSARGFPEPIIRTMLLRRHLWLLVFGFVHALLLFHGDILGAYGLAGLLLGVLLFERTDKTLKIVSWVFAGLILLFSLLALVAGLLLFLVPQDVQGEISGAAMKGGNDELAAQGNYALAAAFRAGSWLVATVGTLLMLTVPLAIVLGWVAARKGLLEDPVTHRRTLTRIAVWGITIGVVGGLPNALVFTGVIPLPDINSWMFIGFDSLTGVAGGIGYAALFGLVARRIGNSPGVIARAIAGVGRRSLTFYLLQSLLFAPLLNAWGFGLGQHIGTTVAFAIATGVWVISLVLAVALDAQNSRGPAESLLRRLTYGRHDPAMR